MNLTKRSVSWRKRQSRSKSRRSSLPCLTNRSVRCRTCSSQMIRWSDCTSTQWLSTLPSSRTRTGRSVESSWTSRASNLVALVPCATALRSSTCGKKANLLSNCRPDYGRFRWKKRKSTSLRSARSSKSAPMAIKITIRCCHRCLLTPSEGARWREACL